MTERGVVQAVAARGFAPLPLPSFLRRQEPSRKGKAATQNRGRAAAAAAAVCAPAAEPPRFDPREAVARARAAELRRC